MDPRTIKFSSSLHILRCRDVTDECEFCGANASRTTFIATTYAGVHTQALHKLPIARMA